MKRFTAILLLFSLMIAQTELNQLLKVPLLFEHYFEHEAENQAFSVKDFLIMHYFSKPVKDKDYARDMQLPFKSETVAKNFGTSTAVIPVNTYIVIHVIALHFAPGATYTDALSSAPATSIWQPPKSYC